MQLGSIPETVKTVVDYFVSIGVTSALVAGVVSWLANLIIGERIKSKIKHEYDEKLESAKASLKGHYDEKLETHKAQLKAQSDVEVERLKSDLSIAAAERQVRFSTLHEKRATVIAKVYELLQDALAALSDYTKVFEPAGGSPREERRKKVVETANAFAKEYVAKKIFVPEAAAVKLDEINNELKASFLQFAYGVDLMRTDSASHTQTWIQVAEKVENLSKVALKELEKDFRALLGDVPDGK